MTARSGGQESVKVPGKKRVGVILSNACHSSVVKILQWPCDKAGGWMECCKSGICHAEPLLNEWFQKSRASRLITLLNFR